MDTAPTVAGTDPTEDTPKSSGEKIMAIEGTVELPRRSVAMAGYLAAIHRRAVRSLGGDALADSVERLAGLDPDVVNDVMNDLLDRLQIP